MDTSGSTSPAMSQNVIRVSISSKVVRNAEGCEDKFILYKSMDTLHTFYLPESDFLEQKKGYTCVDIRVNKTLAHFASKSDLIQNCRGNMLLSLCKHTNVCDKLQLFLQKYELRDETNDSPLCFDVKLLQCDPIVSKCNDMVLFGNPCVCVVTTVIDIECIFSVT